MRVAVVTGAGSGIGRGIATTLARRNLVVGVADIVLEAAEETCQLIASAGGVAVPLTMDVADETSVATGIDGFAAAQGRLDVLVNNAGIFPGEAPVDETLLDSWERVLGVNLTGAFLCAKVAVPHLRAVGGGRIVNIASRAWLGSARLVAYSASKGGIISLTRTLAMELGAERITVNAVSPTTIETPLFDRMEPEEQAALLARIAGQPMPYMGTPEDVAAAVAFFASEEAGYITGQHLYVGGGTELRGSSLV